jgi:hypothetical protein
VAKTNSFVVEPEVVTMKQALRSTTDVQSPRVLAPWLVGALVSCLSVSCGKSERDPDLFARRSTGTGGGAGDEAAPTSGGRSGTDSAAAGTLGDSGAFCDSDCPTAGGTGGGGKISNEAGRASASGGESTGGGAAGASAVGAQSDPMVILTNTGKASSGAVLADIQVTHSHFYVDPSARIANTWTWLAVVKNNRKDLACDLSVEGTFMVSSGMPIKIFADVAASPYRRTDASSVFRCIEPGDVGVASGAALEGVPQVSPSAVTEIRYAIVGTLGAEYVPGNWVNLTGVQITESTSIRPPAAVCRSRSSF